MATASGSTRRHLAVGRGYRTNQSGIEQLTALMAGQGVTVLAFDLPYWNGPGECLHLLSLISMLADDLAVVHKPLMPVALVQLLEQRGIEMVEIPCRRVRVAGHEHPRDRSAPVRSCCVRTSGRQSGCARLAAR